VYSLWRGGSRGGEGDLRGRSDSEEIDLLLRAACSGEDLPPRSGDEDRDPDRELPLEYDEGDSSRLRLLNLFLPSFSPSLSSPSSELDPLPLEEYVSTLTLRLLFPSFSLKT
jgi:hypothetical protein